MFTKVTGFWSWMGVAAVLIALFLVLDNSRGAERVGATFFGGIGSWFKILQGR